MGMLEGVKSALTRLRSHTSGGVTGVRGRQGENDGAATEDSQTEQRADSSPHLYECPSCDRVFIAREKQTCSTCETDVQRTDRTA